MRSETAIYRHIQRLREDRSLSRERTAAPQVHRASHSGRAPGRVNIPAALCRPAELYGAGAGCPAGPETARRPSHRRKP